MLIAGASLTYVSLFAKFYNWGGGWSWGPRYLMPIVPLLMVPVARAAAASRVWRYAAIGLFIAGLLVNGVGVLVDGDAYHTAIMDIDLTARTGAPASMRRDEVAGLMRDFDAMAERIEASGEMTTTPGRFVRRI